MRRSASEIIRELESRVALLEKSATRKDISSRRKTSRRDEIDYNIRLELIEFLEEAFEDELDEDGDELDAEWVTVEDKVQNRHDGNTYILANVQNLYWGIIKVDSRNRSTIEGVSADSRELKAIMKRLKR